MPWLYDWTRRPYGTQEAVRRAILTLYNTSPSGYPGNDDLGTMSAWYVFGALGLYPEVPGVGLLAIGSPLFPRAVISLPNHKKTTITTTAYTFSRAKSSMRQGTRKRRPRKIALPTASAPYIQDTAIQWSRLRPAMDNLLCACQWRSAYLSTRTATQPKMGALCCGAASVIRAEERHAGKTCVRHRASCPGEQGLVWSPFAIEAKEMRAKRSGSEIAVRAAGDGIGRFPLGRRLTAEKRFARRRRPVCRARCRSTLAGKAPGRLPGSAADRCASEHREPISSAIRREGLAS